MVERDQRLSGTHKEAYKQPPDSGQPLAEQASRGGAEPANAERPRALLSFRSWLEGRAARGDVGAQHSLETLRQYEREQSQYRRRELAAHGDPLAKQRLASERERARARRAANVEHYREFERRHARASRERQKQKRSKE